MRADDLVLKAEVKEVHDLLVLGALVGEQVLHRVHVVGVPLELQALRVALGTPERHLVLLPEHAPVEQVVDPLIVNLHETHVDRYFSFSLQFGPL